MYRSLRNRTVVVTLIDGSGIRGTVVGTFWCLRIAAPVIIEPSERPSEPLEGSFARIPRRSVVWLQEV
jgi:hypothetical protein